MWLLHVIGRDNQIMSTALPGVAPPSGRWPPFRAAAQQKCSIERNEQAQRREPRPGSRVVASRKTGLGLLLSAHVYKVLQGPPPAAKEHSKGLTSVVFVLLHK
jgi:hypothetical protein